jgi:ABC-type Fe3+-hydroxamate transport system substrate-binding protein
MEEKIIVDQLNRQIRINYPPKRIISTVPSQTELLYDLGLNEEVIAITKFCIHPEEWFKTKTRIGGTKKLNIEKIKSLNPDLIIANKEENTREEIEELANLFPVWISDIKDLNDALAMIHSVGEIVNKQERASLIADEIEMSFKHIKPLKKQPKLAYFIWREPWMLAGKDTFINSILSDIGFDNIALKLEGRYPEISATQLQEFNPEYLFLSSEPYPFCEKHFIELMQICPNAKVKLVDGELFSWYGSRLLHSAEYMNKLLCTI